mgnify:FL=1
MAISTVQVRFLPNNISKCVLNISHILIDDSCIGMFLRFYWSQCGTTGQGYTINECEGTLPLLLLPTDGLSTTMFIIIYGIMFYFVVCYIYLICSIYETKRQTTEASGRTGCTGAVNRGTCMNFIHTIQCTYMYHI